MSLLLSVPMASGRTSGMADTSRTYRIREMVVTGLRTSPAWQAGRARHLSPEDLEARHWPSLGSIADEIPGALLREYGGGGALQTISLRGMGAEHTMVLLDGVPMNSAQTGITDFRLLPTDAVTSVEASGGGNSALLGSSAIGGVIDMVTVPADGPDHTLVELSAGSFGTGKRLVGTQFTPASDIVLDLGFSKGESAGRYSFDESLYGRPGPAIRTNMDYSDRLVFVSGRWNPPGGFRSTFSASTRWLDRGTPGPFALESNQGLARQSDEMTIVSGSVESTLNERLGIGATGYFQNSYEHFADASGPFPADNYYRNVAAGVRPIMTFLLDPALTVSAGAEVGTASANGNALSDLRQRTGRSLFMSTEFRVHVISLEESITPSVRYDDFGEAGSAWSPRLAAAVRWGSEEDGASVRGTASVGRDFRVPTLNELWYAGAGGYGNPALVPERSFSAEAGLSALFPGGHEVAATYYSVTTRDRIVWMPAGSALVWTPENVARTHSTGVELACRASIPSLRAGVEVNYTVLNARNLGGGEAGDPEAGKQLITVPLETGRAALRVDVPLAGGIARRLRCSLEDTYLGIRYTTPDNSASLPSHHLVRGSVSVSLDGLGLGWQLRYDVGNLADLTYEVMPRYPMPPRNHLLTISLKKTY